MSNDALAPDVVSLLRAHDVEGEETPVEHNGFSGARITTIDSGGQRYWLKRLRFDDDWIMQALEDTTCREAEFAVSPIAHRLPKGVATPTLGAARDGDGWAILSHDITSSLLAEDGIEPAAICERMISALASLHAAFWDDPLDDAAVSFCSWDARSAMLSPVVGARLASEGRDFGIVAGWQAFERMAPAPVSELLRRLRVDPSSLGQAIEHLTRTLLHGDAKMANVGLDADGIWLFDWAIVMHAPVGFELGWMLAVNASRFPWHHDETLQCYATTLKAAIGPSRFAAADWPKQRAAAVLTGVLVLGWAKALQAESGDREEFDWWCTEAIAAAQLLRL